MRAFLFFVFTIFPLTANAQPDFTPKKGEGAVIQTFPSKEYAEKLKKLNDYKAKRDEGLKACNDKINSEDFRRILSEKNRVLLKYLTEAELLSNEYNVIREGQADFDVGGDKIFCYFYYITKDNIDLVNPKHIAR